MYIFVKQAAQGGGTADVIIRSMDGFRKIIGGMLSGCKLCTRNDTQVSTSRGYGILFIGTRHLRSVTAFLGGGYRYAG